MRLGALILLVLLATVGPVAGEEALLPAPYQVQGIVQERPDRYLGDKGIDLAPSRIAVDLGDADKRRHPGSKNFRHMTFVGTEGMVIGGLKNILKSCDFLCGDDGQTCHYVGLFSIDGAPTQIGTPLMGIVGKYVASDFKNLTATAIEDRFAAPEGLVGRDFTHPIWSRYKRDREHYRISEWDADRRALNVEFRFTDGTIHTTEASDCTLRRYGELASVTCNPLAFIAAGGVPLLVSFPDYNVAGADITASFVAAGRTYYVVRLGLKAQTVFGLLTRTGGRWHARIRPYGYPLLC